MYALIACIFTAFSVSIAIAETLEEAIINDILPPSSESCKFDPESAESTSSTFAFTSSQAESKWFEGYAESAEYGAPWSNLEQYVFSAQMTHVDSNLDRDWKLRFGTGGNIYSMVGPMGETIAPQKRTESPWIDDVWHSVCVDTTKNPISPFMIHGAGSYQSDSGYTSSEGIPVKEIPFYSPSLGKYCRDEIGTCGFSAWAQHGPIPVKWISPNLNFNRYKDCGNGVIEHTMVHHNNNNQNSIMLNRIDAPFGSIRQSVLRDMVLTNQTSEILFKQEDIGQYDKYPDKRKADETLGYVVFAEDLPSSRSGTLYPLTDGVNHIVTSGGCKDAEDQYPYKAVKCKLEPTFEDPSGSENGVNPKAAITIYGKPSTSFYRGPDVPFHFMRYGSGHYCRPFGVDYSCRLNPALMNNYVNNSGDRSFIQFTSATGEKFKISDGVEIWSLQFNGIYSMIINAPRSNLDLTIDEINDLIAISEGPWYASYFNPPNAGGEVHAHNGVIHWSMRLQNNGSYWLYFYPDEVSGVSDIGDYIRNKFPPGSELEMRYHNGKPEIDNLAFAHIYGNDFSNSQGITPGWPLLITGQGIQGAKPRDANFYNLVTTANLNTKGGSHHYRQYFIFDRFHVISDRAKGFVDKVIHDNYNVNLSGDDSKVPPGRTIHLYTSGDETRVQAAIGESNRVPSTSNIRCTGSTTPKMDSMALFYINCGSEDYIGPDPYYLSSAFADENVRPYTCLNDPSDRGDWTLLGFFADGACASLINGYSFEKNVEMENSTENPSGAPSSSPSSKPSHSPSIAPSQNPSVRPSQAPSSSSSKMPSLSPSSEPSHSPSIAPSQNPSIKPSKLPSSSPSNLPSPFSSSTPPQHHL
eukprot:CAMPEP_0184871370 /NCGR_PEP_ID=MMETSP0580-20130426/40679_1 /TAXON_ID=1118495 /ORGANISM="Dactyliosolen fragilissimus" /LENGTH=861 /DNA_ID=CAMNT_0027374019 /DNA_START=151 /DNA_END=2737 /DNA_ORIENTATION=+